MAKFLRLHIRGIRSVGDEDDQVHKIEFLSPCTLISGPNGTGKTTTIEALNFITTGQMPTARKQAFIHSIDTARKTRVDASVTLEFIDVKGRKCTAVRRLVATTGTKNTAQSEEHTMAIKFPDGTVQTLSSKVVDFNKAILHHLGVPKAIFKYVIFCHQEDSTWPLSEPKELKKRFDEIFQLTKFVKAQERMKKIVTDFTKELRTHEVQKQLHENHLKDKIIAKQNHDDCVRKINKGREMLTKLKEAKTQGIKRIEELRTTISTLEATIIEFHKNKSERDNLLKQIDLIRVEPYCGTENELRAEIEDLRGSDGQSSEGKRAEIDRKIARNHQEKQGLLRSKTDLENRISSIKAKVLHCQSLKNDLQSLDASLRSELDLDEDIILEFELEVSINRKIQEMTEKTQLIVKESADLQKEMRKVQENVTKIEVELRNLKSEKQKLEKEVLELKEKIRQGETASSGMTEILKKEENLRKKLEHLQNVDEKSVESLKRQRESIPKEIDVLRQQCQKAEKNAENEKEIENLKKTVLVSTRKLGAYEKKNEKNWMGILGMKPDAPWTPILTRTSNKLRGDKKLLDDDVRDSQLNAQKLETIQQQLGKQEKTLTAQELRLGEQIYESCSCEPEDVVQKLEDHRKKLKKIRKELAPISAKADIYDSYIEDTRSNGCCPLCERNFKTKKEIEKFSERLQNLTLNLPSEQEELEKTLVKMEEEETKLVRAESQAKELEKIGKELKEIREKSQATSRELREAKMKLSKSEELLEAANSKIQFAENLQVDVGVMDQIYEQTQENQQKIDRISGEISSKSNGGLSYSELREKLEEKEKEYRQVVKESDKFNEAVEERNQLISKLNELGTYRVSLGEAAAQTGAFAEQMEKKKQEIEKCRLEMDRKENYELPDAMFARQETTRKVAEKEEEKNKKMMEMQLRKKDLEQKSMQYKNLLRNVQDGQKYERELGEQEINIGSFNERLEENQQRQKRFEEDLRSFDSIHQKEVTLKDQLTLLTVQRKLGNIEEKISSSSHEESEQQIAGLKGELSSLQREMNSVGNEEIKIFTQKEAFEKQLEVANAKLNTKECRMAEHNYRDAIIELEITNASIEDLNKYRRCLDTSLIKFHTEKMAAVNVIVDELWRKVYNSTDITTIRIRSDATSETSSKRASYEYNVMMVQESGSEVEMRGRCSAGQKMLASLLIRIALAEVFGGLCSMIALDEPTTNLDESKVDGMAQVLNELIEAKKGYDEEGNLRGREMQMVVITHDERLVNKLTIGCRPEYIYCLGKDEYGVSYLLKRLPDGSESRVTSKKR